MASYNDQYRLGTAQALAVASVGGAVTSSAAFGAQTKRIRLSFPGSTSSTGGLRYTVVDPGVTVSSTAGPLLPANFIEVIKVTPGQRVSAISNDAGTFSLSIHRTHRLAMRDYRWMRDLSPDKARAAIAALDKQPPPDTVRGILEMRAMREALQAKAERKRPPARGR